MTVSGSYNIDNLMQKVLRFTRAETFARIGANLVFNLSSYFQKGSKSRHKWANKLGATPTGMLDFLPSRGVSNSKTGATIYSTSTPNSASMVIDGVKGIERAFHPLDIYPSKASALTVPINKVSYAKTVGDLKGEGWQISRRGRTLVGSRGGGGENGVPLFVLCGHVHINQDKELLPSSALVYQWAINEAEREIREVDAL